MVPKATRSAQPLPGCVPMRGKDAEAKEKKDGMASSEMPERSLGAKGSGSTLYLKREVSVVRAEAHR